MEATTERPIGLFDLNWQRRPKQAVRVVLAYIVLAAGAVIFLLPLAWMAGTSLKTQPEVYTFPPTFFPESAQWKNFPDGWTYPKTNFPRWLVNTLFITVVSMLGTIGSAAACAYGFARIRFPGRDFWFMLVLASIMLPGAVTLIPLFILYFKIGWLDTFYPMTVPAFFGGGAFAIFLMRQFFKSIPMELEEAAIMDGASRLRIFWQIMMPLSKPVLATIAVLTFQSRWNDFYGPLIILSSPDMYTLALGINSFKGLYATQIPLMMAMSFLMVVPMIIVFFVSQKQMIRGVILSGLKG
jgi:ABC-type glycerol-3-phosphate transport system permease component